MATTAGVETGSERRFFSWMAVMMIVLMAIGFGPSFYLKDIVPSYPRPNPTLTPLILLHGLAFTLWMFVFWAQTALVASDRRELHRKVGVPGMLLAAALVPLMYLVAVGQVARANQPPFVSALAWTAVPLSTILPFALLIWLGWRKRRESPAHKRLMLSAALLFMWPSVGRFPLFPPDWIGQVAGAALSWATYIPLLAWDLKTLGRLHWATWLGVGLAAGAMIVANLVMVTPGWERLAAMLPGV